MLLRPTDTNRPGYVRAEAGMAISRVQADSSARDAQVWAQQKRRSMSLATLAREIQSGSGLSPSTF